MYTWNKEDDIMKDMYVFRCNECGKTIEYFGDNTGAKKMWQSLIKNGCEDCDCQQFSVNKPIYDSSGDSR